MNIPPDQSPITPPIAGQTHPIPKCLHCGAITLWQVEPLLLPRHFIIGLVLLCAAGSGLIYFLVIVLIRSNPNNRHKICPQCHSHNLWTFIY